MISKSTLIFRSLTHYWKSHLLIALGAAISAMVLTGTFIVGDSVDSSLRKTAELRLGKTTFAFTGIDRYFRLALADEIAPTLGVEVAPVIQLQGMASSQGGNLRLNNVNVMGVDQRFGNLVPSSSLVYPPPDDEAFISQNLSNRLQLSEGDVFLLRLEKATAIPKNAPFISDEDNLVSLRLKVAGILGPEDLGRFNLKASQTAPFNVFLPLAAVNKALDLKNKANTLLIDDKSGKDISEVRNAINSKWKSEDLGLKIVPVLDGSAWEVRSERVFIESKVIEALQSLSKEPEILLTYFANTLEHGKRQTPYSFIAAGPYLPPASDGAPDRIIINQWLADDLEAGKGDSIEIAYYSIGPLRRLQEKTHWFVVDRVVPLEGVYADTALMPTLPGLTDAGSCSDWDTGIPIDLDKIRDKDEAYWNQWRGTPKAFINYSLGKSLWQNRFGECTAIRLPADEYARVDIENALGQQLKPEDFGFTAEAVKARGLQAAAGGVDFSQLFMGMSFFLLVAGLTLMVLLFNLHLEKRMSQAGTLKALGYSNRLTRQLMLSEGMIVALLGVITGGLLAILYNKLIFYALNTVWNEIVRTSVLQEDIRLTSVALGVVISFLLAWLTIWWNARKKLRDKPTHLQRGIQSGKFRLERWLLPSGLLMLLAAIALLIYQLVIDKTLNAGIFFAAGGLLLVAILLLSAHYIKQAPKTPGMGLTLSKLSVHNIRRNSARSLRIAILFALGTFVVVSTGLNKKDVHRGASDKSSGTGAFLFYGETTLPVLKDLNTADGRSAFGIESPLNFVQMRKNAGDDASCLNLNRVAQPRILGLPAEALQGRFSFVKSTSELDQEHPWQSLEQTLPGGVIPAIADQTVIQWGLGMKVGDTLTYTDEKGKDMKLKLIGGLANSIFQGNVLIDESHFLEHYPFNSGTHVLLVEGDRDRKAQIEEELNRAFRSQGLNLIDTADRLASFNEIQNTYLSIFLILGGLGMILGAVGLGVSLARNIMDRRQELAIMKAIGYRTRTILRLLTMEHMILLAFGTIAGALTAFIATMPSIMSQFVDASWQTALVIILLIVANGLFWTILIARQNLKKQLLDSLRTE